MILITVIIPFYNRIKQTLTSLQSVLLQTYQNLEIIVVDDGSKDITTDVIEHISSDPRVIYIRLDKNAGPAAARNEGIGRARGEYLAFLDSDDLLLPEKIDTQLKMMQNSDAIISHTSYIMRFGGRQEVVRNGKLTGRVIPLVIGSCHIATPTVMVRKDFLVKNRIRFIDRFRYGEDICFWLEILRRCELLGIDIPLSVINSDASSTTYNPQKNIEGLANILQYVLGDEEYRGYYEQIAHLCKRYISISRQIGREKEINHANRERTLQTIKRQGIFSTMYKLIIEKTTERS